ncbi:MAG TPA: VWA domain-containing protein [Planctomycetota bacterium]|nr:VWA domain-containing protein [Planctomycetota bacterium]
MRWTFARGSTLEKLIEQLFRLLRQLLVILDGDVERSLEELDRIAQRYRLWRDDFGPEDFRRLLERSGEARQDAAGTLQLTRKGERALRRQMLHEVFAKMKRGGPGDHRTPQPGGAGEPADETRPYEFGDPVDALDAGRTLQNWIRRTGGDADLSEGDLEVREREYSTACATVLLIDVSHSMTLYGEDRITPAKRVALALAELITTKYPKDTLDVVLFGDEAKAVPLEKLPYITNGPFHTNTRAGLILAQEILKRRKGANRQIVMLTDGKPSAIHEEGRIYKNPFGLDAKVVARTLDEAARCRRSGIPITTFMLTADPYLRGFVEEFTEVNRGRAYFAESARLEGFVLVDFLRNRRRKVR